MKKIVAVTIVSAFLVFLSLYTVNAVIMGQQKSKLREISQTLLQYSEGLSQSVAQTLKGLTTQGCDKASLDRYRQIKLDSLYFADIGFIEQGKIICTAFWGKLAKEGANKRGNSSRLTQPFHFFMFEPIFSPVNALNQPI